MYAQFYGFRDLPFRITPDPRLLYRNACYEEAAAALAYGIEQRKGFLSLVGEAGTGKTTLLRHLLDALPATTRTVLLLHPTVGFDEILEYVLQELGIPTEGARKLGLLQRLGEFLLEHTRAGGNVALLIDEAQDLDAVVLEELRLLSNLETGSEKILQILLAGQPELEHKLAHAGLRQLRQRIAMHVRLQPLGRNEVAEYVRARLRAVGGPDDVFTAEALARIAEVSTGIPRVVNVLCDACLVTGVAAGTRQIGRAIVDEAWADYARLLPADAASAGGSAAPPERPADALAQAPALPTATAPVAPLASPAPAPVATPPSPSPDPPAPAAPARPATVPEVRETPPRGYTAAPFVGPAPGAARGAVAAAAECPVQPESAPAPVQPESAPAPVEPPTAPERVAPAAPPRRSRRAVWISAALLTLLGAAGVGAYAVTSGLVQPPAMLLDALLPHEAPEKASDEVPVPAPPEPHARTPVGDAAAPPGGDAPGVDAPLTGDEARAVVQAFRLAYEDRDVDRLAALFAPDAVENERTGVDRIAAAYRAVFASIADVRYTLEPAEVTSADGRVIVRAPFRIRYAEPPAGQGELRGTAAWEIARREGLPRIVALRWELASQG